MEWIQIIELIAATIGILYLWLEMRASIWLWPVGIVLPLFYIYISWESKVYGNMIVNAYYIVACIWGWYLWRKHRDNPEREDAQITHLPRGQRLTLVSITLLMMLILYPLFVRFMDSPYPMWDVLATSLSLVGMWLLAKKYIENWYCWIASNAIYCALYFLQEFMITGVFFVVYTVIAIMGYFNWRKMMLASQRSLEGTDNEYSL